MKILRPVAVCAMALAALGQSAWHSAWAETPLKILVSEAQFMGEAQDIVTAADHENGLRILPVIGRGSVVAFRDLKDMPELDAAIIPADALAYQNMQKLNDGKFNYLARLHSVALVLVTRTTIANITQLAGKRIATGPAQSAGFATGELLFGALDLPFIRVAKSGEDALLSLRSDEADAALVPVDALTSTKFVEKSFHVLPVVLPPQLEKIYESTTLTAAQLPGLIKGDAKSTSFSVAIVLAMLNIRQNREAASRIASLEKSLLADATLNPDNQLAADVPGWEKSPLLTQNSAAAQSTVTIEPTGATP